MVRRIPLSGGQIALVDDCDYEAVARWTWHLSRIYARHTQRFVCSDGTFRVRAVMMHRFIMKPHKWEEIDHINGDGLDNRRCNLRVVDRLQNAKNRTKETKRQTSSKYKGVSWNKNERYWWAYITSDQRKRTLLGKFVDELEAARTYDEAAKRLHGEYARLNFPEG